MALTGHLSDLSLSELIEFFCNQRKTGCLNVLYPQGHGSFYLQSGSVVDAKIGVLHGIDAVYYALTLPNAEFEFKGSDDIPERTINQPWTQVVLEGLRRLDEGIDPANAFPDSHTHNEGHIASSHSQASVADKSPVPTFLAGVTSAAAIGRRKPFVIGAVAVAVLGSVVAIGVPAGWYRKPKPVVPQNKAVEAVVTPQTVSNEPANSPSPAVDVPSQSAEDAALAAKRQREKDKEKEKKAREERANAIAQSGGQPSTASAGPAAAASSKKVTVTVSYDESGRVVQASGADPTAVRIARQKHFPPGKAGTATVTISMN